jgi:hypothetical protein
MVALMAVLTLATVGFFQFLGEQVTRGQQQIRQTSYLRYLGDAALTEATVALLKELNSGQADISKFQSKIGQTIPVPLTTDLGEIVLGRAPAITVRLLKDRDRNTAKDGIWGNDPDTKKYGNDAFPDEDAGLVVLVASIEMADPAGSKLAGIKLSGQASRAFAYRLVSPAPPKGLNKVTFVAHNWEYFRERLMGAHQEVFSVLVGSAMQKAYGAVLVNERFTALEGTVAFSRGLASLSKVLIKTAGIGGSSSGSTNKDTLLDDMQAAIQEECVPNCREAIPGMQADTAEEVRDCLILMPELFLSKRNQILGLLNETTKPKLLAHKDSQGNLIPERELTDDEIVARLNALLSLLSNGSTYQYSTGQLAQARQDLITGSGGKKGALYRPAESATEVANGLEISKPDGLRIGGCQRKGARQSKWTKNHREHREAALKEAVRRYGDAWKENIKDIFGGTLQDHIKTLQNGADSAGVNLSLENILLFSRFKKDGGSQFDTSKIRQETLDALKTLKVDLDDQAQLQALQYEGMSELKGPVEALVTRLQELNDEMKRPNFSAVKTITALSSGVDALRKAYLADEESHALYEGPLYLTDAVDSKRLEYLYSPSPHRTNMVDLFPLPPLPFADPAKLNNDQRGFLVAHANWGRPFGEKGATGDAWKAPYDQTLEKAQSGLNNPGTELLPALRQTEGVAMDFASAYGVTKGWKKALGFDDAAMDLLLNKEGRGDGKPYIDLKKMDGEPPPKSGDNPMAGGKLKDNEALAEYATKWNELVDDFTKSVKETHDKHAAQPFKVWPLDLPPEAPPSSEGWDGSTPEKISSYSLVGNDAAPGLIKAAAKNEDAHSKGGKYISAILQPDLNRQRSAFRFNDIKEFNQFLIESCGMLQGTYFISGTGKDNEVEWKISELRSKMAARCPNRSLGGNEPLLQGFGYLAFPGRLVLDGSLEVTSPDGGSTPGSLVLVAQGVTMKSASGPSKVNGVVLSNGPFFVDENSSASIEGALVTTGTQTKGDQVIKDDKPVPYEDRATILGKQVGALADLKIEPNPDIMNAPPREQFMRILFSPFRVAEDFEVRRR